MKRKNTPTRNTALRVDETDMLRLQNLQLRQQLLQQEASQFGAAVVAKYQNQGETIQVQADGTIVRTQVP